MVDNLKEAIIKACYCDHAECAEGYGFIISPCPVADPTKKGRVESAVKYVQNNFTPLRTFRDLTAANALLMAVGHGSCRSSCSRHHLKSAIKTLQANRVSFTQTSSYSRPGACDLGTSQATR